MTSEDFPPIASEEAFVGEGPMNFRDLSRNCMARDKVLYDGHAVAAVAATSPSIAEEACELIEVEYHVLPYVIDVEEAMKPDAPLLHDDLFTQGVDPKPTHPSNVAKVVAFNEGRHRGRVSATPTSSSSGAIRTHRCTRPISSRMPASCRSQPTASARSGARARANSWCAPIARNCSASTSPISARSRPRSVAGLAARPCLPRTGRAGAGEEERPAGQDGNEPRGGLPRHWPCGGLGRRGQAWRQEVTAA